MSLAYNGSITPSGTVTLQDGVVNPTTNFLNIVESNGPSMRMFNLNTLAQVGSAVVSASVACVAVINAASSVAGNSSNGTIDFIENSSGYRTTATGGTAILAT